MKTRYLFFFVLVALVLSAALPVGVVQAAGKTASLVEFKHVHGKGWTAVFQISGNWKAADLKGNTITVGGKTYDLYCNFRDDNHVSCTMHHDLGLNVGKSATLFFGGQTFGGSVPTKQICNSWVAHFDFFKLEEIMHGGTFQGLPYAYWHEFREWGWGTVAYADVSQLPSGFGFTIPVNINVDGYDTAGLFTWLVFVSYSDATCREDIFDNEIVDFHTQGIEIEEWQAECIDGNCEESYYYCEGTTWDDCVQN